MLAVQQQGLSDRGSTVGRRALRTLIVARSACRSGDPGNMEGMAVDPRKLPSADIRRLAERARAERQDRFSRDPETGRRRLFRRSAGPRERDEALDAVAPALREREQAADAAD